ncbi:MAG TPA: YihY/virulence factor BrkB family protein [Spirochaetota bacterium]|nr:YihY/virulence factor BrkB family protein [Spirochaetota bacterium]
MVFRFLKSIFLIIIRGIKKFGDDQGIIVANGLAFKTIFAIIAVFAVFIGVFSAFPTFDVYKRQFFDYLIKFLVPSSVDEAIIVIDKFLSKTNAIGTVGTIALIYLSIGLFISLDNQVNKIWTSTKRRGLLNKILIYWVFLTVTPIVVVGYFYYSTIIHSLLQPFSKDSKLIELYYTIISFAILEIFVFFIYFVIPNTKVNPFMALIVSLFVTTFWTVFRYMFTFYTKFFFTNWIIYGSIAAVLFFMFWIYVNWIILLFGVEVLYIWQNRLYHGSLRKLPNFYLFDLVIVIMILKELYHDFKKNGKGISATSLSLVTFYDRKNLEELLILLEKEGLIISVNGMENRYHLKKDLNIIKISDIESVVKNKNFYKIFNNSLEFQKLYETLNGYYNKKEDVVLHKIIIGK